jgi:MFS family permease
LTFALLLFAYLFSQFFRSFLTIIAADLTRDLGFDAGQLGWISAAWFITFACAQFLVGYLLDTLGPRRTTGGLMVCGVAGALIFALSGSFATSVTGMALVGIGCAPMLMASLYIFGRTEPPARFATLASFMVGFGNIGNLAAATPLALAAQTFGWRWSMAAVGLAMGTRRSGMTAARRPFSMISCRSCASARSGWCFRCTLSATARWRRSAACGSGRCLTRCTGWIPSAAATSSSPCPSAWPRVHWPVARRRGCSAGPSGPRPSAMR